MQFGLYGTAAHVTVGSPEVAQAVLESLGPLPEGRQDKQFEFGLEVMQAAEKGGFDIILWAERHLGADIMPWLFAAAVGSRLERMKSMVAVHPGLWHPTLIAKMSTSLDRLCKGGSAINIVAGANEAEFQMFGGTAMLDDGGRYVRATEFIKVIQGMYLNDRFSFNGKYYQVEDAELRLKPRSASPPEIFTAASSDPGREMVAEVGDWWFLPYSRAITTPEELLLELEKSISDMTRRMERRGRKVRFAFNPFIGFGSSNEDALEKTVQRILENERNPDTDKIRRSMLPPTLAGCMGTAASIRRQLKRFEDMGIELILFKLTAGVEDVARIGEEIIQPYRQ